jgi:hypothetical protein
MPSEAEGTPFSREAALQRLAALTAELSRMDRAVEAVKARISALGGLVRFFNGGPTPHAEDDPLEDEGGAGVREPIPPRRPVLVGAAARAFPPEE